MPPNSVSDPIIGNFNRTDIIQDQFIQGIL
jgi:hypothetical protein